MPAPAAAATIRIPRFAGKACRRRSARSATTTTTRATISAHAGQRPQRRQRDGLAHQLIMQMKSHARLGEQSSGNPPQRAPRSDAEQAAWERLCNLPEGSLDRDRGCGGQQRAPGQAGLAQREDRPDPAAQPARPAGEQRRPRHARAPVRAAACAWSTTVPVLRKPPGKACWRTCTGSPAANPDGATDMGGNRDAPPAAR